MAIKIKNLNRVKTHYSIFDFDCHFDFDYSVSANFTSPTKLSLS